MFSVLLIQRVKEKVHLSRTDTGLVRNWWRFFQTMKIFWKVNLESVWDEFTYKGRFRHAKLCLGPQFWDWKWDWIWLMFQGKFEQKKIYFSSESVNTKEHKENNSCQKYDFSINAFYKINFWPILKKLSQNVDFLHLPPFEIFAVN